MFIKYTVQDFRTNEETVKSMDYEHPYRFLMTAQIKVTVNAHKLCLYINDVLIYTEPINGNDQETCVYNGIHKHVKQERTKARNALIDLWEECCLIRKRSVSFSDYMPTAMQIRYDAALHKNLSEIDRLEQELLLY